jgi:cytochrome-b5 reductase
MDFTSTLLMNEFVTHDVRRLVLTKPEGFAFEPGQGVELAIDAPEWRDESRPFTPTSLNADHVVEFTIKGYPEHHGVTEALHALRPGATLLMSKPFGAIRYQGPGWFIAGGAGVTPFIAILRHLAQLEEMDDQFLIFSNKTPADIILAKELRHYLGDHCILACTRAGGADCAQRRIDKAFLEETIDNFDRHFYVCGPPPFMETVNGALEALGADPQRLVFED